MGAEVAGIFAPIEYDEFLQLRNRQVWCMIIYNGNITIEIDLLLSVINVSVQAVDIVNNLPKLKFD